MINNESNALLITKELNQTMDNLWVEDGVPPAAALKAALLTHFTTQ